LITFFTENERSSQKHGVNKAMRQTRPPASPKFMMQEANSPADFSDFSLDGGRQVSPGMASPDVAAEGSTHVPMFPTGEFTRDQQLQGVKEGEILSEAIDKHSVIVLGCGCYRIGSSVEFDWCSVQAVRAIRAQNRSAIIINCNPETVSTDYDESDRLYFEELSEETVLDIYQFEDPYGLIVSVGGQAPNNLAMGLATTGKVRVLGTSVQAIDHAENRFKFSALLDSIRVDQPEWSQFVTFEEALSFAHRVKWPVLVRPSYVLSGAAMRVVDDANHLKEFLKTAAVVSRDHPVVISKYVENAKEVEFDAVACNGMVVNYAISEHVENAGTHSGDATLLLPAQKLYVETHRRVKKISMKIAKALKISGPFNIQFMCRDNEVKVIECNLRASRTFPFISKTFNVNLIETATKIMLGTVVRPEKMHPMDLSYVGCKVPMFSFNRLKNSDPRLGVEMQSTGEIACYGMNKYEAYLKALLSSNFKLPEKNILISIGPQQEKKELEPVIELLHQMGYQLYCTKGTYEYFKEAAAGKYEFTGVCVYKPHVKKTPNVADLLQNGKIDLVINVPDGMDSMGLTDGFRIRRMAIDCCVSLLINVKTARLFVEALHKKWERESQGKRFWGIDSWQFYQSLDNTS
jgi:carbamoyl-phosphate synthase large subunit